MYYVVPRLVGIVTSNADAQAYADSLVQQTIIFVPETGISPSLTLSYEDCALIFVGDVSSANPNDTSLVQGQDSQWYHLKTYAYRIDGSEQVLDANGNPELDSSGNPVLQNLCLEPILHSMIVIILRHTN